MNPEVEIMSWRYGSSTGRLIPDECQDCEYNDEEFENNKCLSCKRNPLLDDNYKSLSKEAED